MNYQRNYEGSEAGDLIKRDGSCDSNNRGY